MGSLEDLLAQLIEDVEQGSEIIVTTPVKVLTNCCTYNWAAYGG